MQTRKIKKAFKSQPVLEGAGVLLKRALGFRDIPQFDPFLLLDDFRSDNPSDYLNGFPWHPHRGIETITYVLKGEVEHQDSMKNKGVIAGGDVQWMTAGSGIIHQEMPKGDKAGSMHGFQLWANLPAKNKMMQPRYQEVKSSTIPEIKLENGIIIRLICGEYNGVAGPVKDIVTDPEYMDISIPAGMEYIHPTPLGHTVFVYVIDGKGHFCEEKEPFSYPIEGKKYYGLDDDSSADNHTLLLFEDGNHVKIKTLDQGVRFLIISGKPIKEPIAWYGPIVMNTQKELETAFREYQEGTFIK